MGLIFSLAARSLRNRLLTTVLTLISIALSIALLVGVENVRVGMRESFSNTIRGTDLIVGPRSSSLQLLLYSVFGLGSPLGNNMSYETFEHWKNHPAVLWTIPYSLGDSHRNFRVIGTTDDFYEHYKYREGAQLRLVEGRTPQTDHEVVLGSEVAERLGYSLGQNIAVTHGLREGPTQHAENPFTVVGILARTFTPIDRSLYVTLEGIHTMHEGWESGAPPMALGAMPGSGGPPPMPGSGGPAAMPGSSPPPAGAGGRAGAAGRGGSAQGGEPADHAHADADSAEEKTQITAFFVGTRARPDALRLQRDINTYEGEPLTAILPGVALREMWDNFGHAETGLKVISFFVVAVGLTGMLVSLYSSLNARRREMAILRAVGAGPRKIISLLVLESGMMAVVGSLLGVAMVYLLLLVGRPVVEANFGLFIPIRPLAKVEYMYIGVVCVAGFLIGLVPAWKAYRNTLADGLSVKL